MHYMQNKWIIICMQNYESNKINKFCYGTVGILITSVVMNKSIIIVKLKIR